MYQFFVETQAIQKDRILIENEDVNHIKNVLRMKVGETLKLTDAQVGESYLCRIEAMSEEQIICTMEEKLENTTELPAKIYLFQGLPKADKMELIIQKAVELGVYQIIPVAMKRCVVKLDDKKAESKRKRWQGISEAAAKQSKRQIIPEIGEAVSFKQALQMAEAMDVKLLPYECAEGMQKTRACISAIKPQDQVAIFIGPEGGFEESEVAMAFEKGIEPITLGKRILRTETAGFTTLAYIGYHLED